MKTLGIVISAYNEERTIERVLRSVAWADEILVVDNESTDKTVEIAKRNNASIISRPNNLMLNNNKNEGFLAINSDWILNLDADEEVTEQLKKEIQDVISGEDDVNGYWIPRKNIIFGKWIQHGLWWPDKQLRLFRKNKGKFPCVHVHEYIEVQGNIKELNEPYIHYNYDTISQFLHKLDAIYTENEVTNKVNSGYTIVWYDAIRMPISDFVKIYFSLKGYKDGLHGLVLALMQAFYALIVFAKIWEKEKFKETQISLIDATKEMNRAHKELLYWDFTSRIEITTNPIKKILLRVQRKYVTTH